MISFLGQLARLHHPQSWGQRAVQPLLNPRRAVPLALADPAGLARGEADGEGAGEVGLEGGAAVLARDLLGEADGDELAVAEADQGRGGDGPSTPP